MSGQSLLFPQACAKLLIWLLMIPLDNLYANPLGGDEKRTEGRSLKAAALPKHLNTQQVFPDLLYNFIGTVVCRGPLCP